MRVQGMPVSMILRPLLVLQAFGRELLAHTVNIEAELARFEARAHGGFFLLARLALLHDVSGALARDDAHAVIVRDDHIARADERASADDGYVDAAQGLLHGALRADGARPHGELHRGQVAHVAHAGLDDEPPHPAGGERARKEIAEITRIGGGRGGHDEDVAFAALLDCDVNHPVVGRWNADRDGAARDARAGVDGAYIGRHQTGAVLRFVDGRDAGAGQRFDKLAFDALNLLYDAGHRSSKR